MIVYATRFADIDSLQTDVVENILPFVMAPSKINRSLDLAQQICHDEVERWTHALNEKQDEPLSTPKLEWKKINAIVWECWVEEYEWMFQITETTIPFRLNR